MNLDKIKLLKKQAAEYRETATLPSVSMYWEGAENAYEKVLELISSEQKEKIAFNLEVTEQELEEQRKIELDYISFLIQKGTYWSNDEIFKRLSTSFLSDSILYKKHKKYTVNKLFIKLMKASLPWYGVNAFINYTFEETFNYIFLKQEFEFLKSDQTLEEFIEEQTGKYLDNFNYEKYQKAGDKEYYV